MALVERLGEYQLIGQTLDDAAGEALDKGATLSGLVIPAVRPLSRPRRAGGAGTPWIFRAGGRRAVCRRVWIASLLLQLQRPEDGTALPPPPASGGRRGARTAGLQASYQEAAFGQLGDPPAPGRGARPSAGLARAGRGRATSACAPCSAGRGRFGIPFLCPRPGASHRYRCDDCRAGGRGPLRRFSPSASRSIPTCPSSRAVLVPRGQP